MSVNPAAWDARAGAASDRACPAARASGAAARRRERAASMANESDPRRRSPSHGGGEASNARNRSLAFLFSFYISPGFLSCGPRVGRLFLCGPGVVPFIEGRANKQPFPLSPSADVPGPRDL
eukprot:scaffold11317_cov116-Isochrysis_galbana.AAC.2